MSNKTASLFNAFRHLARSKARNVGFHGIHSDNIHPLNLANSNGNADIGFNLGEPNIERMHVITDANVDENLRMLVSVIVKLDTKRSNETSREILNRLLNNLFRTHGENRCLDFSEAALTFLREKESAPTAWFFVKPTPYQFVLECKQHDKTNAPTPYDVKLMTDAFNSYHDCYETFGPVFHKRPRKLPTYEESEVVKVDSANDITGWYYLLGDDYKSCGLSAVNFIDNSRVEFIVDCPNGVYEIPRLLLGLGIGKDNALNLTQKIEDRFMRGIYIEEATF